MKTSLSVVDERLSSKHPASNKVVNLMKVFDPCMCGLTAKKLSFFKV